MNCTCCCTKYKVQTRLSGERWYLSFSRIHSTHPFPSKICNEACQPHYSTKGPCFLACFHYAHSFWFFHLFFISPCLSSNASTFSSSFCKSLLQYPSSIPPSPQTSPSTSSWTMRRSQRFLTGCSESEGRFTSFRNCAMKSFRPVK